MLYAGIISVHFSQTRVCFGIMGAFVCWVKGLYFDDHIDYTLCHNSQLLFYHFSQTFFFLNYFSTHFLPMSCYFLPIFADYLLFELFYTLLILIAGILSCYTQAHFYIARRDTLMLYSGTFSYFLQGYSHVIRRNTFCSFFAD